ncbi:MAG: HlyD family efflux transporter periplasmic adaptor subunit [Bryobacter sp.]|nr:HlyD family efflux transporter periplasmic adaptor subunit [Bryobacter sp.]
MMVLQQLVKPGSHVKKGDVIAEFDRQYMLQRLEDYRASVVTYQANLRKLQAEQELTKVNHNQSISVAKANLDKAELDLKTIPVLGEMDAERLRLNYEEAKAAYKQVLAEVKYVDAVAQAQLKNSELDGRQAKLELQRAEMNADRMIAKAPMDGITVMQNTFRGSEFAQIQQGDQLFPGQFYMQVVDPRSMVVNSSVNQVDAERLRIGMKARVRFDAYPDLELPAHVVAIAAVTRTGGMRASYVKDIPVRLKLDRMDSRVIPDLSVGIDVILEQEPASSAVVSLAGVFFENPLPGGEPPAVVYVKSGNRWEKRTVELGLRNYTMVAVRSGLRQGDVVALEPPPAAGPQAGKS